jgi:hypothetical protein
MVPVAIPHRQKKRKETRQAKQANAGIANSLGSWSGELSKYVGFAAKCGRRQCDKRYRNTRIQVLLLRANKLAFLASMHRRGAIQPTSERREADPRHVAAMVPPIPLRHLQLCRALRQARIFPDCPTIFLRHAI